MLAEPTARELLRVLAYPKFRLQPVDRERLVEDLLPWCESWVAAIPSSQHCVRDPDDQVFLDLALAAATLITPANHQPNRISMLVSCPALSPPATPS